MSTEAIEEGVRIRRSRLRLGMTQRAVAESAGVSQPVVSRIELGRGACLPLSTWRSVARAVGLDVTLDVPTASDWGHATVISLAAEGRWRQAGDDPRLVLERPQRLVRKPFGPRMSPGERVVVMVADVVTDPTALIDDLRAARDLERDTAPDGFAVGGLLVVRRSANNRRRMTEQGRIVRAAFPRSGTEWSAALKSDQARMPTSLGMLWMDPRAQRLIPRFRLRVG